MSAAFTAPRALLDKKPPHGSPCTRCGLCCLAMLCPLAAHVFKRPEVPGPCPALQWDSGEQSVCGLVANPEKYAMADVIHAGGKEKAAESALLLIGSGAGCDARFNGEPPNFPFYQELVRWDHVHRHAVREAKRRWRMK